MAKARCIMVGAGGMAGWLSRGYLPAFRDRLEVVALADVNAEALNALGDLLQVPEVRRYTEQARAFEEVEAEFCMVITTPSAHEETVRLATARGLDILSEKPIADTWEACVRIRRMVREAGVRMMVVQNYRFTPRILTFKRVLDECVLGRPNYLVSRFAADYRQFGAWGQFRHEIPHALLVEGGVHHLDQLRNLAGVECETICGREWNPPWSSFKGASSALYVVGFEGGVSAHYEGNCSAAAHQNNWHAEYYRAECEGGAVVLDNDHRVWLEEYTPTQGTRLTEVPPVTVGHEGHGAIVDQFLNWLDGGPTPATVIDDNIKTAAMLFGAIEASDSGCVVDVRGMVAEAMGG